MKHILVPVEPTEAMLRSAMQYDAIQDPADPNSNADALRTDWRLMLAAAPAVQGEAVYLYRRRGLHDFVTCNHDRYVELSGKPRLFETKVLYTAPQPAEKQPAPDVAGLVEALEELVDLMQGVIDGDYVPDSFTLQPATAVLSAYHKAGGGL